MSLAHIVADHYSNTSVPPTNQEYCRISPDDGRVIRVVELSMLYAANVLTAFQYQHAVKEVFPYKREAPSAVQLRQKLVSAGKRFVGIRYFLFSMSKFTRPNKKTFELLARKLEVDRVDAELAIVMYSRDSGFRSMVRSQAVQCDPSQYSTKAFSGIDYQYVRIEKELRRHATRIFKTKLSYLSKFGFDEMENIVGELMLSSLVAYYKKVPCSFTEEHLLNYLRRTITNAGKNIANAYSAQKRNDVIRNKASGEGFDEYSSIVVRPRYTAEDGDTINEIDLGVVNEEQELHFDIFLVHMADRLQRMPRKLRFLRLLAGWDDQKFTSWLIKHRYIRSSGNCVDFCDRTDPNVYVEVVRQHCRVSRKAASKFIEQLRQEFSAQGVYR
jgi:hypothetical protein